MTTTALPTPAPFDIGRVIQRVVAVLGRNFVAFLLLAILLVGLPTALTAFLQVAGEAPMFANPTARSVGFNWLPFAFLPFTLLIGAAANAVLQGAVIHGTVTDLSGVKITFGEALGTGVRFLLPLIVVGIIAAICVFFGLLIFVVPGVLLALAWAVAAPALVVERTGVFGAFSRSAELTRGCRIHIFALAIIAAAIGFILQMVAGAVVAGGSLALVAASGPSASAFLGFAVTSAVANLVSQTLTALIGAAGIASVYYELRFVKEGVAVRDLASVFD